MLNRSSRLRAGRGRRSPESSQNADDKKAREPATLGSVRATDGRETDARAREMTHRVPQRDFRARLKCLRGGRTRSYQPYSVSVPTREHVFETQLGPCVQVASARSRLAVGRVGYSLGFTACGRDA